jgi:hypothetical protein
LSFNLLLFVNDCLAQKQIVTVLQAYGPATLFKVIAQHPDGDGLRVHQHAIAIKQNTLKFAHITTPTTGRPH